MRYNNAIIFGIAAIILLSGCSQQQGLSPDPLNIELSCPADHELCILGTPGLLNEQSMYSDSDTVFSILLRNNLAGDEANNVKVTLKNLSPFYVIEGNVAKLDLNIGTCAISQGIWKPHEIRESIFVSEPQFITDLGLPFASKMLDTMYPNEEVEFFWNLKAPSRHEIANVAYEHAIDYEVSYDYKTGILQTVYAISDSEYQRALSLGEDLSSRKGTTASSIGALNIQSIVEEPIRVTGPGTQFSLNYRVNNKRSGIPLTPALFVFQYPEGIDHVGGFNGEKSLNSYGYIDLFDAFNFYNDSDMLETGRICLPKDYDPFDPILKETPIEGDLKCLTYPDIIDYLDRNFKDLNVNQNEAPQIILKFLYPINLVKELNPLYYPLITTENVEISKLYTFRLRAKYRYSFGGSDGLFIIPSEFYYESEREDENEARFFGDMGFDLEKIPSSQSDYSLFNNNATLSISKDEYKINSSIFMLGEISALHLVSFESSKEPENIICAANSDCQNAYGEQYYCHESQKKCYYNDRVLSSEPKEYSLSFGTALKKIEKTGDLNSELFSKVLDAEIICSLESNIVSAYVFANVKSGGAAFEIHSDGQIQTPKNIGGQRILINKEGDNFYDFSNIRNYMNCVKDGDGNYKTNTLVLNATEDGTSIDIYDLIIYNSTEGSIRVMEDIIQSLDSPSLSNYYRIALTESSPSFQKVSETIDYLSEDSLNNYINYKVAMGSVRYGLNRTTSLLSGNVLSAFNNIISSMTMANEGSSEFRIIFNNTDYESKDAIIYLSNYESNEYLPNKIYQHSYEIIPKILEFPYFYSMRIGYNPRELFIRKAYENPSSFARLNPSAYYVNEINYDAYTPDFDNRTNALSYNPEFEDDDSITEKFEKLKNFIDSKSFIELNEINLASSLGMETKLYAVDLVGFQYNEAEISTAIHDSMKLMSYYDNETVAFKNIKIGDLEGALIVLYSDSFSSTESRLRYYFINYNLGDANNEIRAAEFDVNLISGSRLASNNILLNNNFSKALTITPLTNINLKNNAIVCSSNHNIFNQAVNKKPIMIINYTIAHGENIPSTYQLHKGAIAIGDYDNLAAAKTALGISDDSLAKTVADNDFFKGVVNLCKV